MSELTGKLREGKLLGRKELMRRAADEIDVLEANWSEERRLNRDLAGQKVSLTRRLHEVQTELELVRNALNSVIADKADLEGQLSATRLELHEELFRHNQPNALREELELERYRHDRLQDFCMAQGLQLDEMTLGAPVASAPPEAPPEV